MTCKLTQAVERAMRDATQKAIIPRFRTSAAAILADKGVGDAAGDEPVTAADRESEAILSKHLSGLIPGSKVVGEEAVAAYPARLDWLKSGVCWLIDPLDGTANFAAGTGPFGMLVALVENGVPVGGWILDPLSGRFCAAQAGRGAMINDSAFRVTDKHRSRPLVAITRLFADPMKRGALTHALGAEYEVVDSPRCAADQYPRVAMGENDVTLFTRTLPWDHAAGVIFLNEAGGVAARPDGTPYRCTDGAQGLIAASSPRLWNDAACRLTSIGYDLAAMSPLSSSPLPSISGGQSS